MTAPCKGCEKRHVGCHSECVEYMEFWNEMRLKGNERRIKAEAYYFTQANYERQVKEDRKINKRKGLTTK